jgi:hypothetical protein
MMAEQGISTGDVTGVGIVIGNESRVVNVAAGSPVLPPAASEALRALDAFTRLLSEHGSEVPDADQVRESADTLKAEIRKKRPNKLLLVSVLRGITASVSGVAALAEAAARIYDAVAHLVG